MILLLIVALLLLLFLEYRYFKKEICAPAILFTAPFIVMCLVALMCADQWNFKMHWNTFFVVLAGNMTFALGAMLAQKFRIRIAGSNNQVVSDSYDSAWKYLLLLGIQAICYDKKLQIIQTFARSHGVSGGLSASLQYYDYISKFTTEETISMSGLLELGLEISTAIGYVMACVLAAKLLQKDGKRKNLNLVLLNFLVAVLGGLTSGGRGIAIKILIAFLADYLLLFYRQKDWKDKSLGVKLPTVFLICAVGIVAFFIYSREMVGRGAVQDVWQYLAKYIGAQLYNLDHYLNVAFKQSEIFGQETFWPLVKFICARLEIFEWAYYQPDLPFVYASGYDMGNVYTTFYAYIHDFGYFGVVIIPLLFGIISQYIYRFAKSSPTGHTIHLSLAVYGVVAYLLIFSFFSNKLGESLINVDMLEKTVYMFLLILFLFHFRWKSTKIYIDKELNQNIKLKARNK